MPTVERLACSMQGHDTPDSLPLGENGVVPSIYCRQTQIGTATRHAMAAGEAGEGVVPRRGSIGFGFPLLSVCVLHGQRSRRDPCRWARGAG